MKDITLIRNILKLVSSYEVSNGYHTYWGHDTSMEAKEIEQNALKILKSYLKEKEKVKE